MSLTKSRIPALLRISSEKNTIKHLNNDIKQLNMKLSQLQALFEEKEAQLCRLRSNGNNAASILDSNVGQGNNSTPSSAMRTVETCVSAIPSISETEQAQERATGGPANDNGREMLDEEEFPEVKVEFQETFLGHTSPISRCRFSASGNNIASASVDGTVRIWTYDSSTPTSRNATIYCGAEIMSLDWDCKSDRLLLIGTADGGIKAWNVDAKRVVCDLNTSEAFPSVLDLKCSPVEPVFVSAAASRKQGSNYLDSLGFASLTVWNMKTWRAMTVLPLGEDPPAITSLCFNHNGKILAAAATDGMIHMFGPGYMDGWRTLPHSAAITTVDWHPTLPIFLTGSADNSVRVTLLS
ncbi:hypothetical protein GH714_028512 [Hevea brasiliensis]|uniref:Anaphase-promoting complex subunit 4 WD40 domain-containing protein n=1 Tax=Hevea brasiliensis TaxID=3981 RepID=A0A6A6MH02_HEVBR|nr:hypothetical protein GH714_028512 [Hevea brasiliensis]